MSRRPNKRASSASTEAHSSPPIEAAKSRLSAATENRSEKSMDAEQPGAEQSDELFVALGRATSKLWSNLPTKTQQLLFDDAISFGGEDLRQPLAVFLHARHTRTTDTLKAEALLEPDSPGG
jgi:hypothetical protein